MNKKSFGICVVGNFDEHKIPEEQWSLTLKLTRALMNVFHIPLDNIQGHNEYAHYKTCPGKNFKMTMFRTLLRSMP
jgi:N-acetyl-anhydromuramyl-L-alanine amidase AmpD